MRPSNSNNEYTQPMRPLVTSLFGEFSLPAALRLRNYTNKSLGRCVDSSKSCRINRRRINSGPLSGAHRMDGLEIQVEAGGWALYAENLNPFLVCLIPIFVILECTN